MENWLKKKQYPPLLEKILTFGNEVSRNFKEFLYNENQTNPALLFGLIVLKHFDLIIESEQIGRFILFAALLASLLTKKNYYFFYLALIQFQDPFLNCLVILSGVCSLNEPSKVCLFLYTLSFSFQNESFFLLVIIYQIITALFICILIYSAMIFTSPQQNMQYFVGFSLAITLSILSLFEASSDLFQILLACLIGGLAFLIIKRELKNIEEKQIQKIENPRKIVIKISLMKKKI